MPALLLHGSTGLVLPGLTSLSRLVAWCIDHLRGGGCRGRARPPPPPLASWGELLWRGAAGCGPSPPPPPPPPPTPGGAGRRGGMFSCRGKGGGATPSGLPFLPGVLHSPVRAGLHPFAVAAVILMPLKRAWALCDAPPQHHSRVPKHASRSLSTPSTLRCAHIRTHSQRACKGGGGRWGRQGQVGGWRMVVNVHTSTTASVRETHAQKVADHFAAPTTSTVAPTNPLDTHSLRRTHTHTHHQGRWWGCAQRTVVRRQGGGDEIGAIDPSRPTRRS